MKKVTSLLALILCVLMLTVSFASCANMDKYEDNLGSDYKIEIYGKVVDDDYGIQKMILATNTKTSEFVMIAQCRSNRKAKDFAENVDELYKSFGVFEVEIKGKFVFFGSEDAIKDALGK